jgi:hypothetical protein
MKLRYRQSGGFAGITKGADLEIESLSPEEAALVRQTLPRLRAAAQAPAPSFSQPDVGQIMVEISEGAETLRLVSGERNVPEEVKPLVELLAAKAQYLKR